MPQHRKRIIPRLDLREWVEESTIDGQAIALGDYVYVSPSEGRHDGFTGKVLALRQRDGVVIWVDVWGGRSGYESNRSILPKRIEVLSERKQKQKKANEKT